MSRTVRVKKTAWFIYFALGIIVFGIVSLVVVTNRERTFPPLPVGTYIGEISGLKGQNKDPVTLYVEHAVNANALLVVVFKLGWRPQLVPLEKFLDGRGGARKEKVPYQAISLSGGEDSYLLSGGGRSGQYGGDIIRGGSRVGAWNLAKAEGKNVSKRQSNNLVYEEGLKEWLRDKSKFIDLKDKAGAAANDIEEKKQKLARLKNFILDEKVLRQRAQQRVESLKTEVGKSTAMAGKVDGDVSKLVSELNLLGRITKRGKAVSLARNVALRENKWYLANWKAQEDATGLDEFMSFNSKIDLKGLEKQYKKARNAQALHREIASEKRKINELEAELLNPNSGQSTSASNGDKSKSKSKKKKSFWNTLFGG